METVTVEPPEIDNSLPEGFVIKTPGEPLVQKPAASTPAAPTSTPAPVDPTKTTPTTTDPKEQPKGDAPKDNTAAPAANNQTSATPPAPTGDIPDDAFYGYLSKRTEGRIKSEQDFVGLINDYNSLLEQAEQGFQPQFKDERAKLVYQIVAENPGNEPAALMRTLRALDFKIDGKSAQEKLFEAYLLDPRNADLSPLEAQKYFEAEYNKRYSDIEENIMTQREQALAVREAEAKIKQLQESFKAAEQPKVEPVAQDWMNGVTKAVEGFGGVKLAFSDNPQEGDFMNMAIDDPQEFQSLVQSATNPQEWWNNFMSQFVDAQGRFDNDAYVRELFEMSNHHKKAQLAFQHGQKLKEIEMVNKNRNASDPKNIDQTTPATTPAGSMLDAWVNAKGK